MPSGQFGHGKWMKMGCDASTRHSHEGSSSIPVGAGVRLPLEHIPVKHIVVSCIWVLNVSTQNVCMRGLEPTAQEKLTASLNTCDSSIPTWWMCGMRRTC